MTDTQPFMDEAHAALCELCTAFVCPPEENCHCALTLRTALSSAYQRGREDAAKIAETVETPEEGEYWIANRIATFIRTERDKG